jgi:2-oxoglutarate ferredoxin oxidoreductase subunit alpha
VLLLSDGYIANGAEPWKLPDVADLPDISVEFASAPNHEDAEGNPEFWPYLRDDNLARPWAIPGTPGLEHRIGGLEKEDGTGNVNYDGVNHERMTRLRAAKVAGIANDIPEVDVDDDGGEDLLVVGWGSTFGSIGAAMRRIRARGLTASHAHLVHLYPFPKNLGEVLRRYKKVLVPEMNMGQLSRLLRAEFLVDAQSLNKIQGAPFKASEIEAAMLTLLETN